MTEAVQLALIDKVPSIVAAVGAAIAGWFSYKAHVVTKETRVIAQETKEVARKTEENTNHLKDELVAEVRTAAFAAGQKNAKES